MAMILGIGVGVAYLLQHLTECHARIENGQARRAEHLQQLEEVRRQHAGSQRQLAESQRQHAISQRHLKEQIEREEAFKGLTGITDENGIVRHENGDVLSIPPCTIIAAEAGPTPASKVELRTVRDGKVVKSLGKINGNNTKSVMFPVTSVQIAASVGLDVVPVVKGVPVRIYYKEKLLNNV